MGSRMERHRRKGWRDNALPIYHHFYVECHKAKGWVVPPDLTPEPGMFQGDRRFGEFAWVHPRQGWLALFWGAEALFPMRSGPPADRRGSALLDHLDRNYDYGRNADQLCWLPYPELVIDGWDTEWVTIAAQVPAAYGLFFGDGQQRFPRSELLGAGVSEIACDRWRRGWLACKPVDRTVGKERFQLANLLPNHKIKVTWQATIREFVGEPHARLFSDLRQYGKDEDLRLLAKLG